MYRSQLSRRVLAALVLSALVAGCSGGGSPPQASQPTPSPVSTTTAGGGTGGTGTGGGGTSSSTSAYTCSTSDSTSSVARGQFVGTKDSMHRGVDRAGNSNAATGLIAVTYANALGTTAKALAVSRESAASASLVREMTFPVTHRYERIVHVTPGTETQAIASLRTQPGVLSAAITGTSRSEQTVSQKYYPNDPYFNGFTEAQIVTSGGSGSATYHVDPYEEGASVPGQWGDQAIRLGDAEEYSQSGNGSGITNAGALGSASVKIAIIDSGQDSTQPELSSKITYQKCYVTSPSGVQSTSNYSVDEDGHGTDVSGIAAAQTNNDVGFVGSGGAATIYAYRVFPTPDDTCVPGYTGTVDSQCDANTVDIASAINDAIQQKVNVISLSLGGGGCTNGTDEDPTEGNAIAAAIAANIVVVAASGNDSDDPKHPGNTGIIAAPACDNGVIAVGASALSDGVATGTSTAPTGSSSSPVEYVASYSQYGSPAADADSASSWGIVAPGGDPNNTTDENDTPDELHWIENIWTSTPYMANSSDTSFSSECDPDFGDESTTIDCRTLIAGTSQATPLVAGAAALIIAANPNYQSPSAMKQLLFSTAHDIGDAHEGAGRLDLYRAMATAVGDMSLPASK
jgi:subtilisin family serine protease